MPRSIEELIKAVKVLPPVQHRAVAALVGSTVADAAARPLHWIYDQDLLDNLLTGASDPEFWPESKSPFYTIPLGETSSYNDMASVCLKSMYENNSQADLLRICESINSHFGKGTAYEDAFKRRRAAYDPTKRGKFPGPIEGPWLQSAVIKFLENYTTGKSAPYGDPGNKEFDGFCLSLPVIAKYASLQEVWNMASPIIAVLTTNEEATHLFHSVTILLCSFIQGVDDPFEHAKTQIKALYPNVHEILIDVEGQKSSPYIPTVARYGKACGLPGSLIGAYLALLTSQSYVDAVRINITAGGCCCSRSNVIGACFGAKFGIDGIPLEWMKKVNHIEELMEQAIAVVSG